MPKLTEREKVVRCRIGATSLLSISSSDTRFKHLDSKSKTGTRMAGVFDFFLLPRERDITYACMPYMLKPRVRL